VEPPQPGPRTHTTIPPFNVNKVNLETQNAAFVPSQGSVTVAANSFGLGDGTEMDISVDDIPSPATSNSRTQSQSGGGSTSHSSHSPGTHPNERLAYRPSPRMANQIPLPHASAPSTNTNGNFFTTTDDLFNANMYNTGTITTDHLANNFMLGNEWELGGMAAASGMTPMSDGGWNQMLDSIHLTWDANQGVGPPQDNGLSQENRMSR
jgi:hypothetical protein